MPATVFVRTHSINPLNLPIKKASHREKPFSDFSFVVYAN
ncbi:hypothetical protein PRABACTJOHN_04336 [Parabacteroides johnsonii DSM 18315]|uniref:Uncharacterized protein n=1 Tax=Parabacteroides johnsonii DSM 18315 TaxID=537006 RepID=B7BGY7_9BACT|nr:hypothetical protein PRABACTJOHN_04336 [Parabacteroides johnsonii DSM 18315]